jgi:hypothetical protein
MAFPATFADLQANVIAKARVDSTEDTQKVSDWINSAYYSICTETNFYATSEAEAPLTAGDYNVLLPADIVKIEYITPTGSDGTLWGPMRQCTFEEVLEVRAWQGGQISTGAPSRFALRDTQPQATIEFWPMANGGEVLTVWGWKLPPVLANPGDVPIIPEPYSKVIEYGAVLHAAEFKKDLLMIQQYETSYATWLGNFNTLLNRRRGSQTQQFRIEGTRPWPKRNSVDQGY